MSAVFIFWGEAKFLLGQFPSILLARKTRKIQSWSSILWLIAWKSGLSIFWIDLRCDTLAILRIPGASFAQDWLSDRHPSVSMDNRPGPIVDSLGAGRCWPKFLALQSTDQLFWPFKTEAPVWIVWMNVQLLLGYLSVDFRISAWFSQQEIIYILSIQWHSLVYVRTRTGAKVGKFWGSMQ